MFNLSQSMFGRTVAWKTLIYVYLVLLYANDSLITLPIFLTIKICTNHYVIILFDFPVLSQIIDSHV
jgi:hypothetical protein